MASPPIELRRRAPDPAEFAAITLFAVAIDAQLTVNIKLSAPPPIGWPASGGL